MSEDVVERLRQYAVWLSRRSYATLDGRVCDEAAAEIERLRKFASRIWLAEDSPAWAHDAAAKVLDEPSLAHGASEVSDWCQCCNPAPDNYEVSFTEDPMFCDEAAAEIERLRADLDEAREAARETCYYAEVTGNPPLDAWHDKWPWLQNST